MSLAAVCRAMVTASNGDSDTLTNAQPQTIGKGSLSRVVAYSGSLTVTIEDGPGSGPGRRRGPDADDSAAVSAARETTKSEDVRTVPLHDVCFKIGGWSNYEALVAECNAQAAAARDAGLAPAVYYHAWPLPHPEPLFSSFGAKSGVLAMQRLTGPTLLRWLQWTRQTDRGDWPAEVFRLRQKIADIGLFNPDTHENNIMFDVSDEAVRAAVFEHHEPSIDPQPAVRAMLLEAIARGPGRGAQLMLCDWGCARPQGALPCDRCLQAMENAVAQCVMEGAAEIDRWLRRAKSRKRASAMV